MKYKQVTALAVVVAIVLSTASAARVWNANRLTDEGHAIPLEETTKATFEMPHRVPLNTHFHEPASKMAQERIRTEIESGATPSDVSLQASFSSYSTEIEIGSPPQPTVVLVDTGSSDLLLPTTKCKPSQCGSHIEPYFNTGESNTNSAIKCSDSKFYCSSCEGSSCGFEDKYGDGTELKGYIVEDKVTWGNWSGMATFGGITKQSTPSAFGYGTNGILGLAYQAISSYKGNPLFPTLVAATGGQDVFTMCMSTELGGAMTLGGSDSSMYSGSMEYTDITEELYYVVDLEEISVDNKSIPVSSSTYKEYYSIVDSGTTLVVVPETIFEALANSLLDEACAKSSVEGFCNINSYDNVFRGCASTEVLTDEVLATLPAMEFSFKGGLTLELTAPEYLINVGGCYILGIQGTQSNPSSSNPLPIIFGDTLMRNYAVEFNRERKSVGFAPQHRCGCQESPIPLLEAAVTTGFSRDGCSTWMSYEVPLNPPTDASITVCNADPLATLTVYASADHTHPNSNLAAWTIQVGTGSDTQLTCESLKISADDINFQGATHLYFGVATAAVDPVDGVVHVATYEMAVYSADSLAPMPNGAAFTSLLTSGVPMSLKFTAPANAGGIYAHGKCMGMSESQCPITLSTGTGNHVLHGSRPYYVINSDDAEYPSDNEFTITISTGVANTIVQFEVSVTAWTEVSEAEEVNGLVDPVDGYASFRYPVCDSSATVVFTLDSNPKTSPPAGTMNVFDPAWLQSTSDKLYNTFYAENKLTVKQGKNSPNEYQIEVTSASAKYNTTTSTEFGYTFSAEMTFDDMPQVKNDTKVKDSLCPNCCKHYEVKLPQGRIDKIEVQSTIQMFAGCKYSDPSADHSVADGTKFSILGSDKACPSYAMPGTRSLYLNAVNNKNETVAYDFTVIVYAERLFPLWLEILLIVTGCLFFIVGLGLMILYGRRRTSERREYTPISDNAPIPGGRGSIQDRGV